MLPRPVDASWIASQPSERKLSMIVPTCSSPSAPRCQAADDRRHHPIENEHRPDRSELD
jgi:hypothetical protein